MSDKPDKILLAMPAWTGFLHTLVVNSVWNAIIETKRHPEFDVHYRFLQRAMIDRARQGAHEFAIKEGYDYIFWWDDDMLAEPNIVYNLWKHQKDIVSAMYFIRSQPHAMYAYRTENLDDLETFKSVTLKERDKFIKDNGHGLIEVDATGTGCTLMKVDIVKDMPKPWWRWPEKGAEDISFCIKAKRLGHQAYVDMQVATHHLDFQPTPVTIQSHVRSCEEMNYMIKKAPEIKDHEEYHKISYLIEGALDG